MVYAKFGEKLCSKSQGREGRMLTRLVYGHDDRPVLQLYCFPLVQPGGGADGAQHHPQGWPYDRAVVQGQVVAEVPHLVVPEASMKHNLGGNTKTLKLE